MPSHPVGGENMEPQDIAFIVQSIVKKLCTEWLLCGTVAKTLKTEGLQMSPAVASSDSGWNPSTPYKRAKTHYY